MSKSVKVKCRYYQVRELVDDEVTENILDLRTWIATVPQTQLEDRCKEDNAVKGVYPQAAKYLNLLPPIVIDSLSAVCISFLLK